MSPVRTAFWPHGKQIVFSSYQKNIQIWDITTGDIQKTLTGHSGSVNSVVYSPDGGQIASGSFDRMIKIWSATTGKVQKTLLGHSCPVKSVAFSPDGKQIASGSSDSTIKIWNTTTGELQKTIPGHSGQVRSVVFPPDGKQIASGSCDRKVKLWDAVTGELQKTLIGHTRSVNTVAFSPDGRYIASGSSDTMVNLWDITTGGIKKVLATRANLKRSYQFMWSEEVRTLAFSSNGKTIVSGSDDSSIKIWDISMEDNQEIPESHLSWVLFVSFSPNGKQIVSGSIDGFNYLKLWDVTTGDLQRTLKSEEVFLKAPPYAILAFLRGIWKFKFEISKLKPRHGFSVRNQWIFYEGYAVLFLPPDFRPTCFDVLGDQITVGFLNGRVLTFAIDRNRVQSILIKDVNSLTSVLNSEGVE
jgi:WD40 repeat protein